MIWYEPSSLLATVACQPPSTSSRSRAGIYCTLALPTGRPVFSSVTLPRIRMPRGSLISITFLTAPLVHANSTCGHQIGLAFGSESVHAEIAARKGVGRESPLIVGAVSESDHSTELIAAGRHGDHCVRHGLASIGGQHTALDDRGRLERNGRFLVLGGSLAACLDAQILPGIAEVVDGQSDGEVAADPGEDELPLVVGRRWPRPGAKPLGRGRPERDAIPGAPRCVGRPDALDADLDAGSRHAAEIDELDLD